MAQKAHRNMVKLAWKLPPRPAEYGEAEPRPHPRPAEPVIGQRRSLINSSHFLRPPQKRPRAESLENLNDAARCLVSFTCLKAASRVLV